MNQLSETKRTEILKALAAGRTIRKVAVDLRCVKTTISKLLKDLGWVRPIARMGTKKGGAMIGGVNHRGLDPDLQQWCAAQLMVRGLVEGSIDPPQSASASSVEMWVDIFRDNGEELVS